eukprot:364362-Chlamydomonas_euryale.AAC.27
MAYPGFDRNAYGLTLEGCNDMCVALAPKCQFVRYFVEAQQYGQRPGECHLRGAPNMTNARDDPSNESTVCFPNANCELAIASLCKHSQPRVVSK